MTAEVIAFPARSRFVDAEHTNFGDINGHHNAEIIIFPGIGEWVSKRKAEIGRKLRVKKKPTGTRNE